VATNACLVDTGAAEVTQSQALAAHVGHTWQRLELVEVWFFTAATTAAVQVLGTVALCLALMDLVKAETLVDMSPVVVSETILADVAVCGSPASFPPVLLLDVCVVLPRVTYVLKACIFGPLHQLGAI